MSLWSRMKRIGKRRYVTVNFRDLKWVKKPNHGGYGYTYSWDLPDQPAPGMWVEVEGNDRIATAVIDEVDVKPQPGATIKPVLRVITQHELDEAREAATNREKLVEAGLPIWLDMMRAKAGLPVDRELPPKPPTGWPDIPPRKGSVIGQPAYDRGKVWMRAHHRAVELNRMEDAVIFEQIAQEWYARGRKRKKS
ncbi:hypothetical protein JD276_14040 [Leucobacter sp. CSA1]|uniref:Uncharacterized protein n=1 Tax=Leucobacter chromiisoli TaxID=2796471 RepID=A0A934UV32_9MICO|nr:hypothetical protein [Leucobacter chromiisoli]MBK0420154.1 hypothetical protein [Leucobacter chromiisoli]